MRFERIKLDERLEFGNLILRQIIDDVLYDYALILIALDNAIKSRHLKEAQSIWKKFAIRMDNLGVYYWDSQKNTDIAVSNMDQIKYVYEVIHTKRPSVWYELEKYRNGLRVQVKNS